jgi:3'-5' exoribonuclease
MATVESEVVRLGDLVNDQKAEVFAVLVKKDRGTTKRGEPFLKCYFRDRDTQVEAPLWANNRLIKEAEDWTPGLAYRLGVKANIDDKFGLQLEIHKIRPASEELDGADGYNFFGLVESSRYDPEALFRTIHQTIDKCIEEPHLKQLVVMMLDENAELFKKMPAAASFHHGYTAGLIEHVWSMTRVAAFLSGHYGSYYDKLNPPLNRGVVVAAAILHDIGKLRELDYHPVEARYTTDGSLIGHVLIGRDMVLKAAEKIEGFPPEILRLLEHAILAHHGKREWGAPIVPQTIEALLVHFIDEIDAKMNIAARERMRSKTDGEFTDKVYALDNRRFYKGVPVGLSDGDADGDPS